MSHHYLADILHSVIMSITSDRVSRQKRDALSSDSTAEGTVYDILRTAFLGLCPKGLRITAEELTQLLSQVICKKLPEMCT